MTPYTGIHIIYNPNSTGDSQTMATELRGALRKHSLQAKLIPTKYAGHARELAADIAKREARPLIISSSGDGGYNEVINGVLGADNAGAICAVLPAGNANDHSRTLQEKPLSQQIAKQRVTKLDALKVTVQSGSQKTVQYAHSYVGLGLTPVVAVELNKHSLNALRELWIAVRTFVQYRPFKIRHGSNVLRLDSLLFANINQMAKVLTLAPVNRPTDGKFEIIQFPASHKWQLLKHLTQASITHLDTTNRASSYRFTVIKKMPMQLDGEVTSLPAGAQVVVQAAPRVLRTIV